METFEFLPQLETLLIRVRNTSEWRLKKGVPMHRSNIEAVERQMNSIIIFLKNPKTTYKAYFIGAIETVKEIISSTKYWKCQNEVSTNIIIRDLDALDNAIKYLEKWRVPQAEILNLKIFDN
jgi:hypothetical protein